MSHSCRPLFGFITARTRLIRRSALVKVPSFSRNDAPGRNTWANFAVSLMNRSCTTTSSIALSAAVTCPTLGSDCAMSSPWTNRPRKGPSIAEANLSGLRQKRCPPEVFKDLSPRVVGHVAIAAELVRERPHVAGALHVVLAAQRVHADAVATDIAACHRQVGHAHHHRRTLAVFGHPEAVVDGAIRSLCVQSGGGAHLGGRHARELLHGLWAVLWARDEFR